MTLYWLIIVTDTGPHAFGVFFTEAACEMVRAVLRVPGQCIARDSGVPV